MSRIFLALTSDGLQDPLYGLAAVRPLPRKVQEGERIFIRTVGSVPNNLRADYMVTSVVHIFFDPPVPSYFQDGDEICVSKLLVGSECMLARLPRDDGWAILLEGREVHGDQMRAALAGEGWLRRNMPRPIEKDHGDPD